MQQTPMEVVGGSVDCVWSLPFLYCCQSTLLVYECRYHQQCVIGASVLYAFDHHQLRAMLPCAAHPLLLLF
jgi:hypothetical protein